MQSNDEGGGGDFAKNVNVNLNGIFIYERTVHPKGHTFLFVKEIPVAILGFLHIPTYLDRKSLADFQQFSRYFEV